MLVCVEAHVPVFQCIYKLTRYPNSHVPNFKSHDILFLVGSAISSGSNLDSTYLNPPIRILQIISHWVSTFPDLLSSEQLLDKDIYQLPIINSKIPDFHSSFETGQPDASTSTMKSLLPGLIQWCVLAPLSPVATKCLSNGDLKNRPGFEKNMKQSLKDELVTRHHTDNEDTLKAIGGLSLMATDEKDRHATSENMMRPDTQGGSKEDTHSILASLHADLLSNILSLSKPLTCQLSGDDIALVVAALLGYYSQRMQQGKEAEAKLGGGERSSLSGKMDDCVERLAQILQICLSSGLINLRPGEWVWLQCNVRMYESHHSYSVCCGACIVYSRCCQQVLYCM